MQGEKIGRQARNINSNTTTSPGAFLSHSVIQDKPYSQDSPMLYVFSRQHLPPARHSSRFVEHKREVSSPAQGLFIKVPSSLSRAYLLGCWWGTPTHKALQWHGKMKIVKHKTYRRENIRSSPLPFTSHSGYPLTRDLTFSIGLGNPWLIPALQIMHFSKSNNHNNDLLNIETMKRLTNHKLIPGQYQIFTHNWWNLRSFVPCDKLQNKKCCQRALKRVGPRKLFKRVT